MTYPSYISMLSNKQSFKVFKAENLELKVIIIADQAAINLEAAEHYSIEKLFATDRDRELVGTQRWYWSV